MGVIIIPLRQNGQSGVRFAVLRNMPNSLYPADTSLDSNPSKFSFCALGTSNPEVVIE